MSSIYDPQFAVPLRPPTGAGLGRFRLRGWVCADELGYYREHLTAAQLKDAHDLLPGDDFRRYVTQSCSRLEWYDIMPFIYLLNAVATVKKASFTAQVKHVSEWHADRALAGVSGLILRSLDVTTMSLWLPRMVKTAHDFGELETTRAAEGRIVGSRSGVPQFLVHIIGIVSMAFMERTLTRRNAKNPRVFILGPTQDGERFGHPTYRVPFEIQWGE